MLEDGSFVLHGKREDHGKDRILHFDQKSDWVKFHLTEANNEEIAANFRVEKTELAELSMVLFDLSCTRRIGQGWNPLDIIERLKIHGHDGHELFILAENLWIMFSAIKDYLEQEKEANEGEK
jgi:hypothetical protein